MSNEIQTLILDVFTKRDFHATLNGETAPGVLDTYSVTDEGERAFFSSAVEYTPLAYAVSTFWGTYDRRVQEGYITEEEPAPWQKVGETALGLLLLDMVCKRGTFQMLLDCGSAYVMDEYQVEQSKRPWAGQVLDDDAMRAALAMVWSAYDLGRALGDISEAAPWQ